MSWKNKVVWSEGLFLRPQHFQQQDRYLETFVEERTRTLRAYSWGVTELKLDEEALTLGKLAIAQARGVLPDGTPFAIPANDDPPLPCSASYAGIRMSNSCTGCTKCCNSRIRICTGSSSTFNSIHRGSRKT